MVRIVYLLLLSVFALESIGQLPQAEDLFNYEKNFFAPGNSHGNAPFLIAVIPNKIELSKPGYISNIGKRFIDSLNRSNDSGVVERRRGYGLLVTMDSAKAMLFVQGINRKNYHLYEYRVMENRKTVKVDWSSVTQFYNATYISGYGQDDPEMAYLGSYGAGWNNYLTIEVRKRNTDSIISAQNILWLAHTPMVIATFKPNEFNNFLKLFSIRVRKPSGVPDVFLLQDSLNNAESAFMKTEKVFASTENNIIFFLDNYIKQNIVEYRVEGGGLSQDWKLNDLEFNCISLKDLEPGKYKLFVRYSIQRHNVGVYEFEVRPSWQQTTLFKIFAVVLLVALVGFIFLLIRNRKQRADILKEQLKKEKTDAELKAIRSQFNPHFIFNALSSIQSLINRNDVQNANKYLSQFASLMRETLDNSDRQFISLTEEVSILKAYLALEQLRFRFKYEIGFSGNINPATTEIPALLIQPVVENAIRHGVSSLREAGMVQIQFSRRSNDLSITISDNGGGYDPGKARGHGSRLTKDRIDILNRSLKDQFIKLEIESKQGDGTTASLLFKNWFS